MREEVVGGEEGMSGDGEGVFVGDIEKWGMVGDGELEMKRRSC